MSWSYVGLLAGAVAETSIRVPGLAYWPVVVSSSLATIAIGALVIYRSKGAMRVFALNRADGPPRA
jgi:hypothetical protein